MSEKIALFPLYAVLFPDGPLPLRVFEPRYLDMVSDCMKRGVGFGVCLIRQGAEVGKAAQTFEMGTYATIHDWNARSDGLLGVTVVGGRRFRVLNEEVMPDQLLVAEVEFLEPEPVSPIPDDYRHLSSLLERILENLGSQRYGELPQRFDDAAWVSFRLAELLPLALTQKQYFLQLNDPVARLERLDAVLDSMEIQD